MTSVAHCHERGLSADGQPGLSRRDAIVESVMLSYAVCGFCPIQSCSVSGEAKRIECPRPRRYREELERHSTASRDLSETNQAESPKQVALPDALARIALPWLAPTPPSHR